MHDVTDGHWNTAVGHYAYSTGNFSNSTALGDGTGVTASSQVRIGHNVVSIGGPVAWTNLSDKRFKTQIKENVPGLKFIMKLRPVTYHFDGNKLNDFYKLPDEYINSKPMKKATAEFSAQLHTGFIAQEVEKSAESLGYNFSGVDAPKNAHDVYGLRYAVFVVPLVKAVQEQQQTIEKQQQTIEKQQQTIIEEQKINDKQQQMIKKQGKMLVQLEEDVIALEKK